MNLAVEISMYPFNEDYKTLIKSYIDKLNTYADLHIKTSATSTLVIGEFDHVMQVFSDMLVWSHTEHGQAVFVSKFIPGYASA